MGEYHCPMLNKVVTEFTHVVAVRTIGNVFCLSVMMTFFGDVPLQNLNALDNKLTLDFDLVKKGLKLDDEGEPCHLPLL
ncbi:hypothetical protein Pint_27095 [Pistacia integerrima]|uniref:Uncharacterized protein n=1 Tax=Pistacia integerrima TaxID=434235 RepID=A0ACC0YVX3_9ROSI|nr:hypothetical protein Pint_27095 [Pistacia integerrima]